MQIAVRTVSDQALVHPCQRGVTIQLIERLQLLSERYVRAHLKLRGRDRRRTIAIALLISTLFFRPPVTRAEEAPTADGLQEVIVTATLRPGPSLDVPASVRVLDAETLRLSGQQHFEDVTALVPNLNWAGDTSRPRYFQIRGIGELEQYQGAPNPSVGFVIDDIDFSGLGTAATLFDIDHIEVLRGPQGTRYGANALGGLIYMQSAAPEQTFGGRVEVGAADHDSRSYGAVVTGPVSALDSAFRIAVQRYTSDGYYRNAYLGRADTDRNDELTLRGRWQFDPAERLRLALTIVHVQIDNGYDAWTLDNSRTTQSDQPSVDSQHSTGGALRMDYRGIGSATLTMIGTAAQTRVKYGFDADFGSPPVWQPYTYEYSDLQNRDRKTRSLEARLTSSAAEPMSWIIGLYFFELTESFHDASPGSFLDPFDPTQNSQSLIVTTSHYRSRNTAVFGELDGQFGPRWQWSAGLRGERRNATYHDLTTDLGTLDTANSFSPVDTLWGGHATLDYSLTSRQRLYLQVARGYKAGGFNLGPQLPAGQILFAPESDVNIELGYKGASSDRRLRLEADVFYTRRTSLQLKTGEQLDPVNPNTFILYTSNASSGRNYGFESTATWQPVGPIEITGSIGLLSTSYRGLTLNGVPLLDRALPHAPDWQAALAATWRGTHGAFVHADLTGDGSFYYDVPALNPYKSSPYVLVNAKAGFDRDRWSANVWARNITDRSYTVRGFYFASGPPDFTNTQYTQLGPPRTFGVSVTCRF